MAEIALMLQEGDSGYHSGEGAGLDRQQRQDSRG